MTVFAPSLKNIVPHMMFFLVNYDSIGPKYYQIGQQIRVVNSNISVFLLNMNVFSPNTIVFGPQYYCIPLKF